MKKKEFEFIKKIELISQNGRKYHRVFWKLEKIPEHIAVGNIATYMEATIKSNKKEIEKMQELIDDRVIGFSFGKKCKENQEPKYIFELNDGTEIKLTYSELQKKIEPLKEVMRLTLYAPFVIGKNMYKQANEIVGKKHQYTMRIF